MTKIFVGQRVGLKTQERDRYFHPHAYEDRDDID